MPLLVANSILGKQDDENQEYDGSLYNTKAIWDYLANERELDKEEGLTALFLPASSIRNCSGHTSGGQPALG